MTRTARSIAATLAAIALLAALAGCGSSSTSKGSGSNKFRVVLDWTPNTNHTGLALHTPDALN